SCGVRAATGGGGVSSTRWLCSRLSSPGGIHLAAQASLLVRKGLAGTEQEQETEQTGAGDEGRRHGVVRLGERGESSDRLKRRPWRSTLTVRWPMASTRAPATRSPTRRVWPLITARAPSWPRRMACRRSGAAAGAALPWTDAGAAAGGGRVGSAAHTGRARLSSKATSKDLDTQPPRMSTEGMQLQTDLRLARAGLAHPVVQAAPVQLPAAGLHSPQIAQQFEVAAFQGQAQAVAIEHRRRLLGVGQAERRTEALQVHQAQAGMAVQQVFQQPLHVTGGDQPGGAAVDGGKDGLAPRLGGADGLSVAGVGVGG